MHGFHPCDPGSSPGTERIPFWSCSVMASTLGFDPSNPSSNLGKTFVSITNLVFLFFINKKENMYECFNDELAHIYDKSSNLSKRKIIYGKCLVENNLEKDLHLFFYEPTNVCFKAKRPLIIMVHGGGFSVGAPELLEGHFTQYYVEKGFCVAAPAYRLTKDKGYLPEKWNELADKKGVDPPAGSEHRLSQYVSKEVYKTAYRSIRDVKAAIRWLTLHADEYNIDRSNVFLFGESAGALISITSQLSPNKFFFKDDDDVLKNDTTLSTTNPNVTPFKMRSIIGLSGSGQVLDALQAVYYPDLWNDLSIYKNLFLIHGDKDQIILEKFPKQLYSKYIAAGKENSIKFLNVPNAGHVPITDKVNDLNVLEHMLYHMIQFISSDEIICPRLREFKESQNQTDYKLTVKSLYDTEGIKPNKKDENEANTINIFLIALSVILIVITVCLIIYVYLKK